MGADVRTDAEVVALFMEPVEVRRFSKDTFANVRISDGGWWSYTHKVRDDAQQTGYAARCGSLDALHEVEAKLTNKQWKDYCAVFAVQNLPQPSEGDTFADTVAWDRAHLHASPFVKIRALAAVLRDRGTE